MAEKNRSWKRVIAGLLALTLVVGNVPANVGTGGLFGGTSITAYADETETLLTTITATGKEQASFSTANVATVSFSYSAGGSSAYLANWGWWGYGWTATVAPAEGYTITKCVFYDDANRKATDSEAPFVVETTEEDKTPRINGTPIDGGTYQSKGLKKIEVYGYVTPTTVNVSGVELNKTEATLTVNGTETLTATVSPDDAANKTVTWSSDNEAVATVDADGVVTAVSAGTATITATATNGTDDTSDDKTATCAVTVNAALTAGSVIEFDENGEYEFVVNADDLKMKASDRASLYLDANYRLTVSNGKIILSGDTMQESLEVAQLPEKFAGTAYISGTGTEEDPLVVTPNNIYSGEINVTTLNIGDVLMANSTFTRHDPWSGITIDNANTSSFYSDPAIVPGGDNNAVVYVGKQYGEPFGESGYLYNFTSTTTLPEVIQGCIYQSDRFNGMFANVPVTGDGSKISSMLTGGIYGYVLSSGLQIVDTKNYSYKFYNENGEEITFSNISTDTFNGSEAGLGNDVTVYQHLVKSDDFMAAMGNSEKLYIVATEPAAIVNTWTSGNCTVTLDSEGTLTVSKTEGAENGNMADYNDHPSEWNGFYQEIKNVVIENGVTYIGLAAFQSCSNLENVTIPNSVTSIGEGAFANCYGLTSIEIPDSVTSIGNYAFYGCSILASVTIPNSVTSIGAFVFSYCSNLASVTIPNSVTSIGEGVFVGCSNLASVTFTPAAADTTLSIGEGAFDGTKEGTKVAYADGDTMHNGYFTDSYPGQDPDLES